MRSEQLHRLGEEQFDVLIVGAGINGATSAAALAAHGYKVGLIDRGDFASETSMHSSNLAWGGIKYLESHEYKLVRNLCIGRNELMQRFSSTVKEIRFFTTLEQGFRFPPWFLYAGAWVYWLMGNGFTQKPRYLTRRRIASEEPVIKPEKLRGGLVYSDAYLFDNDARFVFGFVRDALERGVAVANYVKAESADFEKGQGWVVNAKAEDGASFKIKAKALLNATGPEVDFFNKVTGVDTDHQHILSKGIHIIVDRVTLSSNVLAFFADDGRLFFAIPMGNKTCIGTTDTRVENASVEATQEDVDFVLDNINKRLQPAHRITRKNIISTRTGVRPLVVEKGGGSDSDFLQLSRKHQIEVDKEKSQLSIFGGKLTDCVNVGKEVVEYIDDLFAKPHQIRNDWYGEGSVADQKQLKALYQQLVDNGGDITPQDSEETSFDRLWRRYGPRTEIILNQLLNEPASRVEVFPGITVAEIEHVRDSEMVYRLEDFLRRRSKMSLTIHHEILKQSKGLHQMCEILFDDKANERYEEYFKAYPHGFIPDWMC